MVENVINITGLQQGSISETGVNETAADCVRTSGYITNNATFAKAKLECSAVRLKATDGSFSGLSTADAQALGYPREILGIPSGSITNAIINNPNYRIHYYWFFMKRYNSSVDEKTPFVCGHVALQIPIDGANKDTEPIRIFVYRDITDYTLDSRSYYVENIPLDTTETEAGSGIDLENEEITYYNSGMSGETTTESFASFIYKSSFDSYNPATDSMHLDLVGVRDSEWFIPDVAILGYNSSNVLIYSERWFNGNENLIDISSAVISKFRFVIRDENNPNFTSECIVDNHFIEYADSWYLDENDILENDSLPEPIEGDIFTFPYPAMFWYTDNYGKLSNRLLPSAYDENHNIVHDDIGGKEYFNQHSGAYDNALKHLNNNYRIRLEILTDEETAIGEITKDLSLTATGQITINYEQITRRSCSLSLINVDNKYIPTKDSPFWLNRKFKLWLGLVVGKDTYWWSQGVFYTVSANATGRILSIEGVDKGGALDGTLKLNMTEAQYKFGRGKNITELIKQTLALDVGNPYGAHYSPIGFGGNRPIDSQSPLVGIEYYGFVTVADISIDANSYISEMFTQMAELYAADCYYNTNGNLVFEAHIDSTGYKYVPTQWEFTDLSSTFEDVNYEYSFEGENVVTVYTNTTEAGVRNVAWTAYNTNPLSPLNVSTGIRRASHIEIPYYYNEELSQEQQEAQQIKDCRSTANHYLLANSMLGMTLNFNAPIIPHMDVNKTIDITDQYADIENGIYVVQSISIPLSSDKMQISATNINWLPNDMTFGGVSEIVQSNNTQSGGAGT